MGDRRISKRNVEDVHGVDNPKKLRPLSLEQIAQGAQETKAIEHKAYEKDLLIKEQSIRDKISNLVHNSANEAIKNNDKLKQLTGKIVIQRQYIIEMRAFQDKDGRILLGLIDYVKDAFNKGSHQIGNTDLDNLKVGEERDGIKRIAIDENLLEIFRDRGFKADIAKGELKTVGTLSGKWDKKECEMDVTFDEYHLQTQGGNQEIPSGGNLNNLSVDTGNSDTSGSSDKKEGGDVMNDSIFYNGNNAANDSTFYNDNNAANDSTFYNDA